jgi:hypothetical protein
MGTSICADVSEERIVITKRKCRQSYCTNLDNNIVLGGTYSLIGTQTQLAGLPAFTWFDPVGREVYLRVPSQAVIRFENRQSLFVQ